MPAREGRRSELKAWLVPPLPDEFCSAICRSKLSSQHPFELRVFLTAGNTAWKISLMQIGSTFSGLGGFLHDNWGMVMELMRFMRIYRTFDGLNKCSSVPLLYRFYPSWFYATEYMCEVSVIENGTLDYSSSEYHLPL